MLSSSPTRLLVTGASGQLGSYLLRSGRDSNLSLTAWSSRPNVELFGYRCQRVDLCNAGEVVRAFRAARPAVIIHAAALSSVGDCHRSPSRARQTNARATGLLAELADQQGARVTYVSTDLVFDGRKPWYRETDCPNPLSVYGRTKASGERVILRHPGHLAVRVSLLYGPTINGRPSFFDQQIHSIRSGASCKLFDDEWRTPLDLQTAADAILELAFADQTGLLHLAGPERLSRLDMGRRLARVLGIEQAAIEPVSRDDFPSAEPRPRDTSLCCDVWCEQFPSRTRPSYEQALRAMGINEHWSGEAC
jgi:dTDP-4-dehydrorhamnose reductase